MGYMTTMIYSGVALVTGYMFLYASDGILTTAFKNAFPNMNPTWFSGFNAVLFTMTFACTSNHMLFLRNAIRGIDYNTVEAARNMGARPFKVLWKVVFPTLIPTMFSLTVMTFITGLCAMSAPTLLGYDSINPEIVRLAGSSSADEAFPQARAALLSIILAMFTIILLTVLSAYERKGHYLSVSKTKARLQKQKIDNPVWNVLAHIYAYVLFIIYMTPVVMRAGGLRVPDQPGKVQNPRGLYFGRVLERSHPRRHQAQLHSLGPCGGAGLRHRGGGLQLHLQETEQKERRGA